jgi:hypothetical protein
VSIISNLGFKKMDNKNSTSSKSPKDVEGGPVAKKTKLVHKTIIYDESIANQWLDEPPLEVWDHHIIPLLSLRDLALARPVCTFFEAYWQEKFSKNVLPLRVGNDVATIEDVMGVVEILSSRREYTKSNPFVVLLGKGKYRITRTSSWAGPNFANSHFARRKTIGITRSNITFVGTGKDTTIILGGFGISNVENITFKHMTLTNKGNNGCGIAIGSNAKVELFDVALKGCGDAGIFIIYSDSGAAVVATRCEFVNNSSGANLIGTSSSATFNDCVFHDNRGCGITGYDSTIHLHGEATAIRSNGNYGISAYPGCKVLIHLPSHHNTTYNNGQEDRYTSAASSASASTAAKPGGTITNVED